MGPARRTGVYEVRKRFLLVFLVQVDGVSWFSFCGKENFGESCTQ